MFGIGAPELIVILVVALLIFGPGKLPEIGGALGKGIRGFPARRSRTKAVTMTRRRAEAPERQARSLIPSLRACAGRTVCAPCLVVAACVAAADSSALPTHPPAAASTASPGTASPPPARRSPSPPAQATAGQSLIIEVEARPAPTPSSICSGRFAAPAQATMLRRRPDAASSSSTSGAWPASRTVTSDRFRPRDTAPAASTCRGIPRDRKLDVDAPDVDRSDHRRLPRPAERRPPGRHAALRRLHRRGLATASSSTVGRPEAIDVPAGHFRALRVVPEVWKIGSDRPSPIRACARATIWVSRRSAAARCLRIRSEMFIGAVTLDLVKPSSRVSESRESASSCPFATPPPPSRRAATASPRRRSPTSSACWSTMARATSSPPLAPRPSRPAIAASAC